MLASVLIAAPAPAASTCTSPPAVLPVNQIHPGMTGAGQTVLQGQTLSSFNVEVLGVIPNAFYLGVDVIVMKMTGPADFVDTTGGAIAGMSGSPIMINGKLAGAVAWGIAEDRTVFGATAAEDMVGLFSTSGANGPPPSSFALTPQVRRAIAAATGTSLTQTATSMDALPVPLGVSGASGARLSDIEGTFADHGIAITAFAAGSASAPSPTTLDPTPFKPGSGFGAGLAYGDVSYYTFGTTTAVCGNTAIAFGHPFAGTGPTALGLNEVDVIAIDNGTFWGTKIGVLGDAHGTMTDDRFPGVVGTFGAVPDLVPVTSSFSSPDTGMSRNGRTDIAWLQGWFVADATYSHAWSNITNVLGMADGPGTLNLGWTITGTREDGSPWSVSSRTMGYSSWSATDTVWRLADMIYSLDGNGFEHISFSSVDMSGEVTSDDLTSTIVQVRTASSLQPGLAVHDVLQARPGDKVTIEVTFRTVDGSDVVSTVSYKLPRGVSGTKQIKLRGGRESYWYGRDINSFDDMLAAMSGGEHPNDLVVSGFGRSQTHEQGVIVNGKAGFSVQIVK
jgi:hypothetical protein